MNIGPVVRISPNELSFASVPSWKDIYGHAVGGRQTMTKSEFYDIYGSGCGSLCIGSERDPKKHAHMKKTLSAAFSTKALQQQESIVQNCVDGFLLRLGADGTSIQGLNMTKWFEMVAFDILGEMAFGESFHCVETGKIHAFIKTCLNANIFNPREIAFLVRYDCWSSLLRHSLGQSASLPCSGSHWAKVTS